ncbi:phosphoribosyltransferase [Candidatus Woesearchaeota archaeon]|nr:phosphoribosyltransferase [Candidatus Woesearchaeota archaeon]
MGEPVSQNYDVVLYAVNNIGITFAQQIKDILEQTYGLSIWEEYAIHSNIDHRVAAELREEDPEFSDADRPLAVGVFTNTELRDDQGTNTMKMPKGKPIFIVHPVYTHGQDSLTVDQNLAFFEACVEKIVFQSPDSPIFFVAPDFPYAMSHSQLKHLKEGHHQAGVLENMVVPNLRNLGIDGIVTIMSHCPNQLVPACRSHVYRYGKREFGGFRLDVVDIDPFGAIIYNGEADFEAPILDQIRQEVFLFAPIVENLSGYHTLIITPDGGQRDRTALTLGRYGFPIIDLDKVRYDEGKIKIKDGDEIKFDFINYFRSRNIQPGDTIVLVVTDDFVNTGGTGNKALAEVVSCIREAERQYFVEHSETKPLTITTKLFVAHAKTVSSNEIFLWNVDEIFYLTTHGRSAYGSLLSGLISSQMQLSYRYVRELEQIFPDNRRVITHECAMSPSHMLAGGIAYMLQKRNLFSK